jgi:hypothetical protein
MQFDPDRLRVVLDNGEVVELDGGTLALGGEKSQSVVLRLAPWRARSVAGVLEEWSAVSQVFHRAPRPILTELELSRTLDLAASALGDSEPFVPLVRGDRVVPDHRQVRPPRRRCHYRGPHHPVAQGHPLRPRPPTPSRRRSQYR